MAKRQHRSHDQRAAKKARTAFWVWVRVRIRVRVRVRVRDRVRVRLTIEERIRLSLRTLYPSVHGVNVHAC